jgi:hypothetical protein
MMLSPLYPCFLIKTMPRLGVTSLRGAKSVAWTVIGFIIDTTQQDHNTLFQAEQLGRVVEPDYPARLYSTSKEPSYVCIASLRLLSEGNETHNKLTKGRVCSF